MRNPALIALAAILVAACATTTTRKPLATAVQPTAEAAGPIQPPSERYGIVDPWAAPDVTASAPAGWAEGSTEDMPAGTVSAFIHPSGRARVFVAVVPSAGLQPAERVHAFIPREYDDATTTSFIVVDADGVSARVSWTGHPTKFHTHGAQGSILLKKIDGRPDLFLLVSGIWPQGETPQMAPGFTAVTASVRIR